MRGKISVLIQRRLFNNSRLYADKWDREANDTIYLYAVTKPETGKKYYQVVGKNGVPIYYISKTELAFVRLIFQRYGSGDYCIMTWAKGKASKPGAKVKREARKGFEILWDGIITPDRRFFRKKNTFFSNTGMRSSFERSTLEMRPNVFSRYFETKRAGIWHSF